MKFTILYDQNSNFEEQNKNWEYLGEFSHSVSITLPTNYSELFIYAYFTNSNDNNKKQGFTFTVPKVFIENNVGHSIMDGSYDNTGWYFSISINILTLNSIKLIQFLWANKDITTAKLKVYYK